MFPFAKIYFLLFGLFTIIGGVIGYVKAGSTISLVAGAVAGLLLAGGGWMLRPGASPVILGLAVVCVGLLFQFGRGYLATQKVMPAGIMAVLALVGLIVAVAAFFSRPSA